MYAGNFDFAVPFHWTVDDVLDADECQAIMQSMGASDWLPSTVNSAGGRVVDARVRNNLLAFVPEAAKWHTRLGESLIPELPARMNGGALVEIGEKLRVYRYLPGHYFGVHSDEFYGGLRGTKKVVSRLTLLIYLNADYRGGRTKFHDPCEAIIEPAHGRALLFQHALEHEGLPVISGEKWVLRTDVFFEDEG